MRFERFTTDHLMEIEWQESQRQWAHLASREVADWYTENGDGLTLLDDTGDIIATAGIVPTRIGLRDGESFPLVSHAVAVFSPRFSKHIKVILLAIRQFLDARPEPKIVMHVWPSDEKASRFAKRLGFVFERSVHEPAIGAFVHIYARTRH